MSSSFPINRVETIDKGSGAIVAFGDAGGNIRSLNTLFGALPDCATVVFLGDAIGDGEAPEEAVSAVRGRATLAVLGDKDEAVLIGVESQVQLSYDALDREGIERARSQLSSASREWLRGLALGVEFAGCYFSHGSPAAKHEFVIDNGSAERAFDAVPHRLIVVSHSQVPEIYEKTTSGSVRRIDATSAGRVPLSAQSRYIINPGAVSTRRMLDRRVRAATLQPDLRSVTFWSRPSP